MTTASEICPEDANPNQRELTEPNHSEFDICSVSMSTYSTALTHNEFKAPILNRGAPAFKPNAFFKPEQKVSADAAKAKIPAQPSSFGAPMAQGLDSLTLNNDFTPSTPYVHKFRTELCKNFELYGKCKYGDEVSF